MEYEITGIPGFENRKVTVQPAGIISGVKVFLDGEQIKPKFGGKYILRRNDGTDVEARLRSNLIDPMPQLTVEGKNYAALPPLPWYELVWSGLPVLMIFIGGALGAFLGVLAAYGNVHIFRSNLQPVVKYLVTAVISFVAVVAWLILGTLLTMAVN